MGGGRSPKHLADPVGICRNPDSPPIALAALHRGNPAQAHQVAVCFQLPLRGSDDHRAFRSRREVQPPRHVRWGKLAIPASMDAGSDQRGPETGGKLPEAGIHHQHHRARNQHLDNRPRKCPYTKKRASEFPPDLATRAFFVAYLPGPHPIDFPPEIKIGTVGPAFLRLEFRGGEPRSERHEVN